MNEDPNKSCNSNDMALRTQMQLYSDNSQRTLTKLTSKDIDLLIQYAYRLIWICILTQIKNKDKTVILWKVDRLEGRCYSDEN